MRSLALGALLALYVALSAAPAEAEMKAQDLLSYCKQPDLSADTASASEALERLAKFSKCVGFVQGSSDMMTALMSVYAPGAYCPPERGMSNEQVVRIVLKWIEGHPEALHTPARLVIFLALSSAFPCRAEPPPKAAPDPL